MRLAFTTITRSTRPGEVHGALWTGSFEAGFEALLTVDRLVPADRPSAGRGLRGLGRWRGNFVVALADAVWLVSEAGTVLQRWACPALVDAHALAVRGDHAFVASTGLDSLLTLDLRQGRFDGGVCIRRGVVAFDPQAELPPAGDSWHINQVCVQGDRVVLAGLRSPEVLALDPSGVLGVIGEVPLGSHDARPHRGGWLFNDTARDRVAWVPASGPAVSIPLPRYPLDTLTGLDATDGVSARQGWARGLAVHPDGRVFVGSSPATVCEVDLDAGQITRSVCVSRDIRRAVHAIVVLE